jgi:hypothetical protein
MKIKMKIKEMDETEKSIMLLELSGLRSQAMEENWFTPNIYSTEHMATAWKLLNWSLENLPDEDKNGYWCGARLGMREFIKWRSIETMPPEKAQRSWLDKILFFAIKSGIIEVNNES